MIKQLPKHSYQVIISNIGTVYDDTNKFDAWLTFQDYESDSKNNYGRASNETVTMLKNGEISAEYNPLTRKTKIY